MGALLLDPSAPSFSNGVAYVWIESRGPADAPARRLAQMELRNVSHSVGDCESIPFDFASLRPPPGARMRGWVDIDGIGPAAPGDLFSTEAVPVSAGYCVIRVEDPTRDRGNP
jgi:hypothetical protein